MKKPPIVVIVIAVLLILVGIGGLVGHLMSFKSLSADHFEIVWIACLHLLAVVAGIFLLRGRNWARWLAIAWMAFHVAISIGHPLQELLIHAAFLLLFFWMLFFRSEARMWFGVRSAA